MRRVFTVVLFPVVLVALTACGKPQTSAAPAAPVAAPAAGTSGERAAAPEGASPHGAAPSMMTGHGSSSSRPTAVERIDPVPGGLSIADVFARRAELAGKAVTVRGQVVKANNQILGRNWIHLQDGSGAASERNNDLTVTSDAIVKVGDIVTFSGVLAVKRDIGEGYVYDAIVEQAKIVK